MALDFCVPPLPSPPQTPHIIPAALLLSYHHYHTVNTSGIKKINIKKLQLITKGYVYRLSTYDLKWNRSRFEVTKLFST